MNYSAIAIFSLSIFIAAGIGAIRIKKIDKAFYPFIFCLWLASVNEIISLILTGYHLNTAVNNNIYVLAEALLIGWQFKNWGLFHQFKNTFVLFIAIIFIVWILEYDSVHKLQNIGANFRIIYSFLIVLMSIHLNNKLIYYHKGKLFKSPVFIIGTGLIIYFTFKIFIEAFLIYGLIATREFYKNLFIILTWINLFVNILYAIAILCIPKKIYYTEPY
jgi:hypothetical protein